MIFNFANNKKKKILIISFTVVIIMILILMLVGNYFFEYALVRNDNGTDGATRNIDSNLSYEIQKIMEKNYEDQCQITKIWLNKVHKQDVMTISEDNKKLYATKFIQDNDTNRYAIIVHGYCQDKYSVFDIANHYYNFGYNVIVPDLRAHGKSEGKYVGMGWLDKSDINKWIDLILQENIDAKIVLHGVSMGAATVMMLEGDDLSKNVVAAIEDCGYTSVKDVFSSELKVRFNLPAFPIINCASFISKFRAGYSFEIASSLDQIKKSTIPTLFIHGSADNFIPIEMCNKLYESASCKKEKLIINGAGHASSRLLDPDKYYVSIFNFINAEV